MARLLLPLLILLTLLPCSALASEPGDYAGRWTFDESSGDRAAVDAAIELAAGGFPKLFRGLVRKRLEPSARIAAFFVFEPGDNAMTISTDVTVGWTTDLAGTPIQKTTPQGDQASVRRWMEGGALHTVGEAARGSSSYVFTLESKTVLRIDVTVSADRLPTPMRYSLHYTRTE